MRRTRAMQILILTAAALFALMAVRCGSEESKPEVSPKPEAKAERNPKWAQPLTKP
ncbi:MAG: hypothetical protein JRF63_08720, partial [Deltaproteobacteria bacterium]|nr:hypothetical protein [Deltaproteobacteria bacterium]